MRQKRLFYNHFSESSLRDKQWLNFFRSLSSFKECHDSFFKTLRAYYRLKNEVNIRVLSDIRLDIFLENSIQDPGLDGGGPIKYDEIAWVLLPIQAQVIERVVYRFAEEIKVYPMHQVALRDLFSLLNAPCSFPIQHKLAMIEEEQLVLPLGFNSKGLNPNVEVLISEYFVL